jgi:hypothetical protein
MLHLNTKYIINNGQGYIVFSEGKQSTVNGEYAMNGKENAGVVNGGLEGNILKGTFHNKVNNTSGLIEFTFNEDGFIAKWKQGLEPGPMRGKWSAQLNETGKPDVAETQVGVYAGMEGEYGDHTECLSQGEQPDFIAAGFYATINKGKDDEFFGFVGLVIANRCDDSRTEVISFPQNGMSCFAVDWGQEALNEDGVDLYAELKNKFPKQLKAIDALLDKYFETDEDEYFETKADIDDDDRLSVIYFGQDLDLEDVPKSNGFNLGQIVSL